MTNDYMINYGDIRQLKPAEIAEKLKLMPGLAVKDMLVSHLVFYNGQPIYTGNGVYVFKSKDSFVYVGSCVARNFVERIPAHFDIRTNGWFNSLLWGITKKAVKGDDLVWAARWAMENCSLILINFEKDHYNAPHIKALEDILRHALGPHNQKVGKIYADERTINDHFTAMSQNPPKITRKQQGLLKKLIVFRNAVRKDKDTIDGAKFMVEAQQLILRWKKSDKFEGEFQNKIFDLIGEIRPLDMNDVNRGLFNGMIDSIEKLTNGSND